MPSTFKLGSNADETKNIKLEADGTGKLVIKNGAGTTLGTVDGSGNLVLPGTISGSNATQAGELITFDQAFGVGQTRQDVTIARSLAVLYTNSTGKPMPVVFSATLDAGPTNYLTISVNGDLWALTRGISISAGASISAVVPPNATYQYDAAGITGGTLVVEYR